MAGWLDKEQTTVDTRVLDVAVALSSELLPEVCGVLVFDIFHDWIPAIKGLA